jgi:hypothetical protein
MRAQLARAGFHVIGHLAPGLENGSFTHPLDQIKYPTNKTAKIGLDAEDLRNFSLDLASKAHVVRAFGISCRRHVLLSLVGATIAAWRRPSMIALAAFIDLPDRLCGTGKRMNRDMSIRHTRTLPDSTPSRIDKER